MAKPEKVTRQDSRRSCSGLAGGQSERIQNTDAKLARRLRTSDKLSAMFATMKALAAEITEY
jgi:hypothetical protein